MIEVYNLLIKGRMLINTKHIVSVYWDKEENITKIVTSINVIYDVKETVGDVFNLIMIQS